MGPWINGGAWLTVEGQRTDILLRDVDRVQAVLEQVAAGQVESYYQPGHPHAILSAGYAAEVFHNRILHDPTGRLAALRAVVDPYPGPLARALVRQFGWEAGFSLANARSAARRGDLTHVLGLAYRAVACLNQVVFARSRRYLVNEKGALAAADVLPSAPTAYRRRVEAALSGLTTEPARLLAALDQLITLHEEVTANN